MDKHNEVQSPAVTFKIAVERDRRRLQKAASSTQVKFKTSRRNTQLQKSRAEEKKKQQEGPTYEAGAF